MATWLSSQWNGQWKGATNRSARTAAPRRRRPGTAQPGPPAGRVGSSGGRARHSRQSISASVQGSRSGAGRAQPEIAKARARERDGPLGAAVPEELGAGPVERPGPGDGLDGRPGRAVERAGHAELAAGQAGADLDAAERPGRPEVEREVRSGPPGRADIHCVRRSPSIARGACSPFSLALARQPDLGSRCGGGVGSRTSSGYGPAVVSRTATGWPARAARMPTASASAPSRIPMPCSRRSGTSSVGSGSVRDASLTLMLRFLGARWRRATPPSPGPTASGWRRRSSPPRDGARP